MGSRALIGTHIRRSLSFSGCDGALQGRSASKHTPDDHPPYFYQISRDLKNWHRVRLDETEIGGVSRDARVVIDLVAVAEDVYGPGGERAFLRLSSQFELADADLEGFIFTNDDRQDADITTARDYVMTRMRVSRDESPAQTAWDWNGRFPRGSNWGLERMGVPQLWNLYDAMVRPGHYQNLSLGLADEPLNLNHEDLQHHRIDSYEPPVLLPFDPLEDRDHGNHVLGIIAAEFNNQRGTDGVYPLPTNVVQTGTIPNWRGLFNFLTAPDAPRVVNCSIGSFSWEQRGIDPMTDLAARREIILEPANVLQRMLEALDPVDLASLPMIVFAAGNESGSLVISREIDAKWNSPFTYLALSGNLDNVILSLLALDPSFPTDSPSSAVNTSLLEYEYTFRPAYDDSLPAPSLP